MSYSPRLLPEGCFALLALIVGAAAYWTLGLGYAQLPLWLRINVSLLHTLITVLATLPALVLCNRWGERKPWVLVIAIPITIVIWVLLFGVIVTPIIDSDAFPRDFAGTGAVVKEVLSVSCGALTFYGVTTTLLATYAFRYSKPARTWAKAATILACLLFAATVAFLPLS